MSHTIVDSNSSINVVRVSETERISIDGQDIITGTVQVIMESPLEVVRVNDPGPQGQSGTIGASGAGKPFYELISTRLYQASASISIFNDLAVTGSAYVSGQLGVGSGLFGSLSATLVVIQTGSDDIVSFRGLAIEYVKIQSDGVTVFSDLSGSNPNAVIGGLYFTSGGFYVGI